MDFKELNNRVKMPVQGFGVFQIPDATECEKVVTDALAVGYRLIDTASVYGNERAVGTAIRKSGIPREELFITTKAWISEMGYERTLRAFDASLARLGLDYLDLYLIHMPFGDYYGAWRAMEELYAQGRVRAIGVCNFESDRLLDLCHNANVIPAVNQVEVHPYTPQTEAIRIMQELGVQAEAWGPLAEGRNGLFTDDILTGIGRKYDKSAADGRKFQHRGFHADAGGYGRNRFHEYGTQHDSRLARSGRGATALWYRVSCMTDIFLIFLKWLSELSFPYISAVFRESLSGLFFEHAT